MKLRSSIVGILALSLIAVTGCGGAEETTTKASAGGSTLEKTTINIGTIPVVDTAPLQIAVEKGLFKAEGLDVKLTTLAGGAEAIPKLKGGDLDVSFGNYVSFFSAAAKGALDLKIVSDGFQSAPKTHTIMVAKDSPIQTVADLKGKTIAVNTKRNISTLLIRVAAKANNFDLDEDKNFVEFPFPEMEGVLKAARPTPSSRWSRSVPSSVRTSAPGSSGTPPRARPRTSRSPATRRPRSSSRRTPTPWRRSRGR
ncbi:ABC transporter substrate-binding protein [Streptosporangium lutulentum]